jgi:glucose/arabinose dehydrogenase
MRWLWGGGTATRSRPSANRITLLRDADPDGIAEMQTVFLQGLNLPSGMTLVGHDFYVANTDAIVRFWPGPGLGFISHAKSL